MGTINYELVANGDGFKVIKWAGLNNTDQDGQAFEVSKFVDISFHVKGTFNGATITVQGDNDPTGVPTWAILHDPQGNDLTFVLEKIEQLLESVHKIRPLLSGGGVSGIDVYMRVKG